MVELFRRDDRHQIVLLESFDLGNRSNFKFKFVERIFTVKLKRKISSKQKKKHFLILFSANFVTVFTATQAWRIWNFVWAEIRWKVFSEKRARISDRFVFWILWIFRIAVRRKLDDRSEEKLDRSTFVFSFAEIENEMSSLIVELTKNHSLKTLHIGKNLNNIKAKWKREKKSISTEENRKFSSSLLRQKLAAFNSIFQGFSARKRKNSTRKFFVFDSKCFSFRKSKFWRSSMRSSRKIYRKFFLHCLKTLRYELWTFGSSKNRTRRTKFLFSFCFSGNAISDSGTRSLARVLKTNRHLKTIFYDRNSLSLTNFEDLVNAFEESNRNISFLQHFHFSSKLFSFRNFSVEQFPVPVMDIIQMKISDRERMEKLPHLLNKVKYLISRNFDPHFSRCRWRERFNENQWDRKSFSLIWPSWKMFLSRRWRFKNLFSSVNKSAKIMTKLILLTEV